VVHKISIFGPDLKFVYLILYVMSYYLNFLKNVLILILRARLDVGYDHFNFKRLMNSILFPGLNLKFVNLTV